MSWLRRRPRGERPVAGRELHIGDPRFDDWEVVRDFGDVETARAWRQHLEEAGMEAVITSDWAAGPLRPGRHRAARAARDAGARPRSSCPASTSTDLSGLHNASMRRTKIVATLGPATHNPEILSGLISVGADVLRLNFSHGTRTTTRASCEMARKAAEQAGREVGLLGDIPGPKLRLGDIEGDVMHLRNGQSLTLTTDGKSNGRDTIPVGWAGLPARSSATT